MTTTIRTILRTTIDDALEAAEDYFREHASVTIDNDGIGFYEAGGREGFDKGTDYPVWTGPSDVTLVVSDEDDDRTLATAETRTTFAIDTSAGELRLSVDITTAGEPGIYLASLKEEVR
jgi:hypothetical protein